MLPLVHSFSPLSSLHMGRSVGRPLGRTQTQTIRDTEDTKTATATLKCPYLSVYPVRGFHLWFSYTRTFLTSVCWCVGASSAAGHTDTNVTLASELWYDVRARSRAATQKTGDKPEIQARGGGGF